MPEIAKKKCIFPSNFQYFCIFGVLGEFILWYFAHFHFFCFSEFHFCLFWAYISSIIVKLKKPFSERVNEISKIFSPHAYDKIRRNYWNRQKYFIWGSHLLTKQQKNQKTWFSKSINFFQFPSSPKIIFLDLELFIICVDALKNLKYPKSLSQNAYKNWGFF